MNVVKIDFDDALEDDIVFEDTEELIDLKTTAQQRSLILK